MKQYLEDSETSSRSEFVLIVGFNVSATALAVSVAGKQGVKVCLSSDESWVSTPFSAARLKLNAAKTKKKKQQNEKHRKAEEKRKERENKAELKKTETEKETETKQQSKQTQAESKSAYTVSDGKQTTTTTTTTTSTTTATVTEQDLKAKAQAHDEMEQFVQRLCAFMLSRPCPPRRGENVWVQWTTLGQLKGQISYVLRVYFVLVHTRFVLFCRVVYGIGQRSKTLRL